MLARDVAKRRALEAQLSYQAFHDPLTGLANRRRFVEPAEAALGGRSRAGAVAALFLDLDDFKTVNDSLGHAAGDELLMAVAARLRAGLRATDVAARLGGDEFGVLLLDIPDRGLRHRPSPSGCWPGLGQPLEVAGVPVEVNASIGVAVDTEAMHGVDDLLSDADVAMYQAKALGKGRQHVFDGNPEGRVVAERPWSATSGPSGGRPSPAARLEPEAG